MSQECRRCIDVADILEVAGHETNRVKGALSALIRNLIVKATIDHVEDSFAHHHSGSGFEVV